MIGNKGDNGKSLIMNTLADIMPNYCKKFDRLTFEEDYKKSHKNLISDKGERIIYLEELSEKKIKYRIVKRIFRRKKYRSRNCVWNIRKKQYRF